MIQHGPRILGKTWEHFAENVQSAVMTRLEIE